jgi:hypothetical protein
MHNYYHILLYPKGKTLDQNYIERGVVPRVDLDGVEKKDVSPPASNQTLIPRSSS